MRGIERITMRRSVHTFGLVLTALLAVGGLGAQPAGDPRLDGLERRLGIRPAAVAAVDEVAATADKAPAPIEAPSTSPTGAAPAATQDALVGVVAPDPALPAEIAVAPPPSSEAIALSSLEDPCGAIQADVPIGAPAGWTVLCRGARAGLKGETSPDGQTVVVYLRGDWSVREGARVLGHELGHAYDFALMTDADRTAWMQQRGLSGGWGSDCPAGMTCDDLSRPAGDWAEAVGEVLVPGTGMWACRLAGPPSDSDATLLRTILASHGARVGPDPSSDVSVSAPPLPEPRL